MTTGHKGRYMISEACVILIIIGLMVTSVTAHPSYSAVDMHPTGMFFSFNFYFSKTNGNDEQKCERL